MNLPRPPLAVILDMDGLTIDTVPAYGAAMVAASTDVGRPLALDYFLTLVGLLAGELEARLRSDLGESFPLVPFLRAMHSRLDPILRKGVALKPGAAELIDFLARRNVPLAVATSMKRTDALYHLDMHGLAQRFRHVVGRDEVANGKPLPDVYLKAVSDLGVAAPDCLALEDSFNGVRAAHAAGVMTVMVPDIVAATPEIAALCVGVAANLARVQDALAANPGS